MICSCGKQQNIEYHLISFFDTTNTTYHHFLSLLLFKVKLELKNRIVIALLLCKLKETKPRHLDVKLKYLAT